MLWAQSAVSFVLWCAFGVWAGRRIFDSGGSPGPVAGMLSMIAGAAILVAGLFGVGSAKGLRGGVLEPWAWLAVTLLGAAFVLFQVWGALSLAAGALGRETRRAREPSVAKEDPP